MRTDLENVDYASLDDAGKQEYAATLQANVNQVILQLQCAKEPDFATILNICLSLRIAERLDLLKRIESFAHEMLRILAVDKKREMLNAQAIARAAEIAKEAFAENKKDIPQDNETEMAK